MPSTFANSEKQAQTLKTVVANIKAVREVLSRVRTVTLVGYGSSFLAEIWIHKINSLGASSLSPIRLLTSGASVTACIMEIL